MVGRLLRARPGLQLPALHGDDLPRVRHARGLLQVSCRHDAPHRLPRADGAGRPRLVPSRTVDLHGVPHVESLALHGTELWAADDVRAAQWRHALVGRATSPVPSVRRLVRHIVPDVPFRPFGRPLRDLAGASPIGGAARSGPARRCLRGARWVCARWSGPTDESASDGGAAHALYHPDPVVRAADADRAGVWARDSSEPLQHRYPRRDACGAVSMDHELLREARSECARRCPVAGRGVLPDARGRRHRPVHLRTLGRELRLQIRPGGQLHDLHGARQHSSLRVGRRHLETA